MKWRWPLFEGPAGMPDAPGQFGAVRKHDVHTGVDLYTYPGMPVLAVEDGVVVAIEKFTGPEAGSPWWNDTEAVLVEGASGVVCYGEIAAQAGLAVGSHVHREDCLGCVKTVLRTDKGRPRTMLHMELYEPGVRETVWWRHGEPRPTGLLDPTEHLETALEGRRASEPQVYQLEDAAIDKIFNTLDDLLLKGDFEQCDDRSHYELSS